MSASVETLIYELSKSIDNIKSEMSCLKRYMDDNVDKGEVLDEYASDVFSAISTAAEEVEELKNKFYEEKYC